MVDMVNHHITGISTVIQHNVYFVSAAVYALLHVYISFQ